MATTTLAMPVVVRGQVEGPGTCLIVNCSRPTLSCVLNIQCLKAVTCIAGCPEKKEVDACYLLCELTYGYNSTEYRRLLQCMSDHGCLPVSPANGVCLADDSDTIKNLTNMAQVHIKTICYYQWSLILSFLAISSCFDKCVWFLPFDLEPKINVGNIIIISSCTSCIHTHS